MEKSRLIPKTLLRDDVLMIGALLLARMHWVVERLVFASSTSEPERLPYRRELAYELYALQDFMEWISPVIRMAQAEDKAWSVGPELVGGLLVFLDWRREGLGEMLEACDAKDLERINALRLEDEVLKALPYELEEAIQTRQPLKVAGTRAFAGMGDFAAFCSAMALDMERHAAMRDAAAREAAILWMRKNN